MKEIDEDLIMKEIMEAFEKVWICVDYSREDALAEAQLDALAEAQLFVMDTIDSLRKENFELYKALHGVKRPEDV